MSARAQAFDFDSSGRLDMDESRELLKVLLRGRVTPSRFTEAMILLRQFADAEQTLSLPALSDAVMHVLSQLKIITDDDPSAVELSIASRAADEVKAAMSADTSSSAKVLPFGEGDE